MRLTSLRLRVRWHRVLFSDCRPMEPAEDQDKCEHHESQNCQYKHTARPVRTMTFAVHRLALMQLLHIACQLLPQRFQLLPAALCTVQFLLAHLGLKSFDSRSNLFDFV
jgi:hypothetical protein